MGGWVGGPQRRRARRPRHRRDTARGRRRRRRRRRRRPARPDAAGRNLRHGAARGPAAPVGGRGAGAAQPVARCRTTAAFEGGGSVGSCERRAGVPPARRAEGTHRYFTARQSVTGGAATAWGLGREERGSTVRHGRPEVAATAAAVARAGSSSLSRALAWRLSTPKLTLGRHDTLLNARFYINSPKRAHMHICTNMSKHF